MFVGASDRLDNKNDLPKAFKEAAYACCTAASLGAAVTAVSRVLIAFDSWPELLYTAAHPINASACNGRAAIAAA